MGRQRGACPVCHKENLLHLYTHLRNVHGMSSGEIKKWLKMTKLNQSSSEEQE